MPKAGVGILFGGTFGAKAALLQISILNFIFVMTSERSLAYCVSRGKKITPTETTMIDKIMNKIEFRKTLLDSETEAVWNRNWK